MADASYKDEVLVVEPHGIEHIGEQERHGTVGQQFSCWFAVNMHLTYIVLGGLGIIFGLGFWGTIVACAMGNFLGALGNSMCVAMGPRAGMPQMLVSRSAFGYKGNYAPSFLNWLNGIGWLIVNSILAAEAAVQLFHVPQTPAVIVVVLIEVGVTVYGYNLIHRWERALTWLSIVAIGILTILAFSKGLGPSAVAKASGAKYWEMFLLEFTILFSSQVSWAPYGADYSRYLPSSIALRRPFWYSFWGLFLSGVWTSVLGAVLGSLAVKGGVIPAIQTVGGGFGPVAYIILILGAVSSNILNVYTAALSGLAWDMPFKRLTSTLVVGAIGLVFSVVFGGAQFANFLKNFLFIMAYWITPWLGIVGIDFYLFHRAGGGFPDFREFYKRNGLFGAFRWQAFLAWVVGIAVSIPFMAPGLFTAPLAKALGGADFSYFVSLIVAGAIYLAIGRSKAQSVAEAGSATD